MGREERDDEPKGFIEEVFEHRQRPSPPADGHDDVEETAPVTDAGDDSLDPGAVPAPGVAGGSGVAADELGVTIDVVPEPVASVLDPFGRALIDETMKKSGLVWLDVGSGPIAQALWYIWLDGAAYVLTGRGEQPDPGLAGGSVIVKARSKETRSRLVGWTGSAARLDPADQAWAQVAAALAKARLNLPDPATAPERWAADDAGVAIFRITPTGPLAEAPGRYSDSGGRAIPVPTPATTAGAPPKVIHRRQTARRPLS